MAEDAGRTPGNAIRAEVNALKSSLRSLERRHEEEHKNLWHELKDIQTNVLGRIDAKTAGLHSDIAALRNELSRTRENQIKGDAETLDKAKGTAPWVTAMLTVCGIVFGAMATIITVLVFFRNS